MEIFIQIVNIIILLSILGVGLYLVFLVIKAMKMYIEKNS